MFKQSVPFVKWKVSKNIGGKDRWFTLSDEIDCAAGCTWYSTSRCAIEALVAASDWVKLGQGYVSKWQWVKENTPDWIQLEVVHPD